MLLIFLTQILKPILLIRYTTLIGLNIIFIYSLLTQKIISSKEIKISKENKKRNKTKVILEEKFKLIIVIFCNAFFLLFLYKFKYLIPISSINKNIFYYLISPCFLIQTKILSSSTKIPLICIINCIQYITSCIINCLTFFISILKLQLPLLFCIILILIIIKSKHSKKRNLKLMFMTLLLIINCQKPISYEIINKNSNYIKDKYFASINKNILNTINNISFLSNIFLNKFFNYNPLIILLPFFNLPAVKSENVSNDINSVVNTEKDYNNGIIIDKTIIKEDIGK